MILELVRVLCDDELPFVNAVARMEAVYRFPRDASFMGPITSIGSAPNWRGNCGCPSLQSAEITLSF